MRPVSGGSMRPVSGSSMRQVAACPQETNSGLAHTWGKRHTGLALTLPKHNLTSCLLWPALGTRAAIGNLLRARWHTPGVGSYYPQSSHSLNTSRRGDRPIGRKRAGVEWERRIGLQRSTPAWASMVISFGVQAGTVRLGQLSREQQATACRLLSSAPWQTISYSPRSVQILE